MKDTNHRLSLNFHRGAARNRGGRRDTKTDYTGYGLFSYEIAGFQERDNCFLTSLGDYGELRPSMSSSFTETLRGSTSARL